MFNLDNDVTRRGFVKGAAGVGALSMLGLAACGGKTSDSGSSDSAASADSSSHVLSMVTDTGGVNDQSFNQSAWEGMQELESSEGYKVSYLESKQESDYATNLDKAVDSGAELVWGIGFAMAEAVGNAATQNPDIQFAIIDNTNPNDAANITGVMFHAEQPSFLVGYIAACTSTTNKVGFVGGMSSDIISQFEYGYKAGVAYANAEKGKNVEVSAQYAESFTDSAKGKAIATSMFTDGCDIVFHAAGGVGTGVIEAAKDAGKFAIGVDRDQAYLAPDNVLTSALKNVNVAVVDVSKKLISGELKGGTNVVLGAAEGAVGIPEAHDHYADDVYQAALALEDKIKNGEITVPASKSDFDSYKPEV